PTHEEPADPRGSASPDGRAQGAAALPPANRAVVESLAAFDDDEPLRRAWLFRSERDVIAWLGTPDLVMYEAGGERWHYSKQDGSIVVAFFARGRLLNIMK
ncbi:MAG: hypothetical protein L6Q95_13500, partial [Planctomycetes bacterium]|nr:hypothetical protein [Planctomycetota bacterium]